jgi:hypothetical protein
MAGLDNGLMVFSCVKGTFEKAVIINYDTCSTQRLLYTV